MPEMPVLHVKMKLHFFSENIISVYLEMVYGGITRLILREICQGALTISKRQYSLDLKNGQERFTFYAFISLRLKM